MQRGLVTSIIAFLILILPSTGMVAAKDCGEQPMDKPPVPEGAKSNRAQITEARNRIIAFSEKIDTYLACQDKRFEMLGPYMTKEQRERFSEDLKKLSDIRRDLQIDINREIRAWRSAQKG